MSDIVEDRYKAARRKFEYARADNRPDYDAEDLLKYIDNLLFELSELKTLFAQRAQELIDCCKANLEVGRLNIDLQQKVQELETELAHCRDARKDELGRNAYAAMHSAGVAAYREIKAENDRLEDENKRLREALGRYADPQNWSKVDDQYPELTDLGLFDDFWLPLENGYDLADRALKGETL